MQSLPTTESELVHALAMFGTPDDAIARRLRIPLPELRRRFMQELQDGASDGVIAAMQTLYVMATGRELEDGRRVGVDPSCLKFYLKHMGAAASEGPSNKTPKQLGTETARQILKTIVGTPADVAEFLRMRRELQAQEDDGAPLIINGERADF